MIPLVGRHPSGRRLARRESGPDDPERGVGVNIPPRYRKTMAPGPARGTGGKTSAQALNYEGIAKPWPRVPQGSRKV